MLNKSLYSLFVVGALVTFGCDFQSKNKESGRDLDWQNKEGLLICVEKSSDLRTLKPYCSALFYFDTDGNPQTAEEMLHLTTTSAESHLRIFNGAKIGTYRSLKEWEDVLSDKYDCKKWVRISKKETANLVKRQNERE